MEFQRPLAYILLILSVFMLWAAWQREHMPAPSADPAKDQTALAQAKIPTVSRNQASQSQDMMPSIPESTAALHHAPKAANKTTGQILQVNTDVLSLKIDTRGGDIVESKLLDYPAKLHETDNPFTLLSHTDDDTYLAQSGLITVAGEADIPVFQAKQTEYTLESGKNQLTVNLYGTSANGLQVKKTYTFYRGKYQVDMQYHLQNTAPSTWQGYYYAQLTRNDRHRKEGSFISNTYFGAAISSEAKHYQKVSFKDMSKGDLSQFIKGGWAAMLQHYFVTAWVPTATDETYHYYSKSAQSLYTIGFMSPEITLASGASTNEKLTLYSGPAIASLLDAVAPHLSLTIDYGWFWFISVALFWVMQHIYSVIGNWGWSIVLVTVLIKLVFYHLSAKSYRSMARMRELQPRIKLLQERFSDDKPQLSKATMELYRKEKVNPLSGCLPLLIQIPVFIGLYWLIVESVQLRQAPFIFWIHDLAAKDPFYVLPVIMGITMFIQQKLSPPPPDPTQAKVMLALPVVFTVFFLQFPAGLVLYWVVNNSLSILQQWYVMRHFKQSKPAKNKPLKKPSK